MKKSKILAVAMSACLLTSSIVSMAACGGGAGGKEGVLVIHGFEGGGGGNYVEALAKAYNKHNPGVKIEPECNPLVPEEAQTALESNESIVDIYMVNGLNIGSLCENANGALEPLNDVFQAKPKAKAEEGDKTIEQLILPEILPSMKYGGDREPYAGNYYALPTGSNPHSLIMNKTVMDTLFPDGWTVPRTTNELIELCNTIKNKNATVDIAGESHTVYSFMYAGNALEYWRYMWYPWIAQYDGIDVYEDALSCRIDGAYNKEAMFSEGKYKAMNALEVILKRANGYCDPDSMSNKHTTMQKYFMQGRAAMMVCGDWIESETETEYKPDMMMVRSPIISDLGTKLGITEAQLRDVVSAIDAGETSVAGVDAADFAAVKDARSIVFTLANTQIAVIPSTSVNKDIAKDFLRFLYSKEGFEVFAKATGGSRLPVPEYKLEKSFIDKMTVFGKSVVTLAESDIKYIYTGSGDPIRYRAGLSEFLRSEKPELSLAKKSNPMTAEDVLKKEKELVDSNWNNYLKQVS